MLVDSCTPLVDSRVGEVSYVDLDSNPTCKSRRVD